MTGGLRLAPTVSPPSYPSLRLPVHAEHASSALYRGGLLECAPRTSPPVEASPAQRSGAALRCIENVAQEEPQSADDPDITQRLLAPLHRRAP